MANQLGALIGAITDRQEGDIGISAITGTVTKNATRALAPIVAICTLGWRRDMVSARRDRAGARWTAKPAAYGLAPPSAVM